MSDREISEKLADVSDELFRLKLRAAYEEPENPLKIRQLRRDIARLKTIMREREAMAAAGEED